MNQKIINEIINQDYSKITKNIKQFLLNSLEKSSKKGLVFGLSGGIDSAVIAYICSNTIKDTLAVIMPDDITPNSEIDDALKVISETKINHKIINIKPIITQYTKYLEDDKIAIGNLRARVRTNILYHFSSMENYLVIGSSDKSEYQIGYFTKFGDGAADITPIISLYKLQVRELAKFLNIPYNIITKKSSPHLWKHHTAEDEIGVSYEEIDSILYLMEKDYQVEKIHEITDIDITKIKKIQQINLNTSHKREMPLKMI